MARGMHFPRCPPHRGKAPEHHLTTLFGTIEAAELPVIEAAARKKNGWLPLLIVLFLISYGLMTMLIVEQGQTIESQRALIRELFRDSTELSAVKLKAQEQRAQAAVQSPSASSKNPSSQMPSSQAPTKEAPSTQAGSQHRAQNQLEKQKSFQMPSRPASDLTERRRALISI